MDQGDAAGNFSERVRLARQQNGLDILSMVLALDETVGEAYEIPSPHDLLRIAGNRSTAALEFGVDMGRLEAVRTDHRKRPLAHLRGLTMRPLEGAVLTEASAIDAAEVLGGDHLAAVLSFAHADPDALSVPFLAVAAIDTCLLEQVPAIASQVLLAACVAQPWLEVLAVNVSPSSEELAALMESGSFDENEEDAVWLELQRQRRALLEKLDLPRPLRCFETPKCEIARGMAGLGPAFSVKEEPKIPPPSSEELMRMGASVAVPGKVMFEFFRLAEGDEADAGQAAARRLANRLVISDFEGEHGAAEEGALVNLRASLISASIHSRAMAMTRALTSPGPLQALLKSGRIALGIDAVLDIVGASKYEVDEACDVAFGADFERRIAGALKQKSLSGDTSPES